MPTYEGQREFDHARGAPLGVLISNLGTPEAPEPGPIRTYLREFLSDPRVVELPRWKWWLILNLFVLTFRPRKVAEAYRSIWGEKGSPLMTHSRDLVAALQARLDETHGAGTCRVELGMRYGRPSLASAIERLMAAGCRKLVHLPLYPQYSASTSGTAFEACTKALNRRRWIPAFHQVESYHDHPAYIAALAASIREHRQKNGAGDVLLFSFHGIPERYFREGDPYHCLCLKTARLVASLLGLKAEDWAVTFQSRFGREPWLKPYTDKTLIEWGRQGLSSVDVVCPGFAADCLETLEEIAIQNREFFVEAGGKELNYIPALNARNEHAEALIAILRDEVSGWFPSPERSAERARAAAEGKALAEAMMARGPAPEAAPLPGKRTGSPDSDALDRGA